MPRKATKVRATRTTSDAPALRRRIAELEATVGRLRDEGLKYRKLHESMWDAFVCVDMRGRVQETNRACEEMLGYTADELRQMTYRKLTPAKWHAMESRIVAEQILPRGYSEVYEKEYRRKDGTVLPVELRTFLVRDSDGQPGLMWAIVRDITGRKRDEEALRRTHADLEATLAALPDLWFELDRDSRVHAYQAPHPEQLYARPEKFIGVAMTSLLPADVAVIIQRALDEAVRTGRHQGAVYSLDLPDRKRGWFELSIAAKGDHRRPDARFVALVRDITRRVCAEQALRASQERLQTIVENTVDIVYRWDLVTKRYDYISPVVGPVLGFSHAEMNVLSWEDILGRIHPEDQPAVRAAVAEAERVGRGSAEYRFKCKNGEYRWLADRFTFQKDAQGRPIYLSGTASDSTERKRAEEALRASEERFRHLAEAMPQAVWVRKADGEPEYINPWFLDYLGLPMPMTFPESLQRAMHPDDMPSVRSAWRQAIATGIPYQAEVRIRNVRNEYHWFLSRALPIRDAAGRVVKWFGTSTNIDEQKRAEAVLRRSGEELERLVQERTVALRESEDRFRQLTETIPQVFWLEEAETSENLYVSPSYEKVWGRSLTDLQSTPQAWMDSIHPGDRERVERVVRRHRLLDPFDVEYRILWPDGSVRWILDRGFPIRDAAGKVRRVAGSCEDITERKRLEHEILDISEREQRRIGHDLHDGLCQVLAGTAYVAAVLRQQLKEQSLPDAAEAEQIEKHLMGAIDQARALARGLSPVDMGADGLQMALEQLARSVTSLFQVSCVFVCRTPVRIGDPGAALHLYRIAQEAVNNACRHGKARKIKIGLAVRKGVVTLAVEDDGIGIPKARIQGPGMGLRIMAYRATVIGGLLTVQSGKRGGTVVRCSCPKITVSHE